MIIVDEPASTLDPEQRAFAQILGLAGPDRIFVLVTHRMAAVRRVDRVFVLDDGRLIEEGSHAELFAAEPAGRYVQMYRLHADQYELGRPARLPGPTRPPASGPA
ncbi:hypothetical protein ACWGNN_29730 [Streptomyces sp. NPDC055817]